MKNNMQKLLTISALTFFGLSLNLPVNAAPKVSKTTVKQVKEITIVGSLTDSKNDLAIKDAYVKQLNTLNTVLTDDLGKFTITLENSAEKKLLITKEGYESIQLNVSSGTDFKIKLYPNTKYEDVNLPMAHSEIADLFNYSNRPIASNFSAFYQLRYQYAKIPTLTGNDSITSKGFSINEVGINGQVRFDKWLSQIKVFRGRYPINVDNFEYQPVYNLDTTQFQLGVGRIFQLSDNVDIYGGLTYLLHFNNPDNRGSGDNKPIPYTNSYQDFPQTRQGPGIAGIFGYTISDKIILNVNASLYPVIFTGFDNLANNNYGYHGMLEAGASIKVETLPGVYVVTNYNNQLFFGSSIDDSNFLSLGISLDPFKMASIVSSNTTKKVQIGN
ncbi:MAG: hypothetical protein H7263_09300 [Candidatus Sericytochromatia bacterium]|nr:hypothetical protein [Candidatus Sericytochromatia bacterium]